MTLNDDDDDGNDNDDNDDVLCFISLIDNTSLKSSITVLLSLIGIVLSIVLSLYCVY